MAEAPFGAARGMLAGGSFRLFLALFAAGCCAFTMTGCAINPRVELSEMTSRTEPLVLDSVPFYAQTEYQCGPAALAGVLGYSGIDVTPEELTAQVYLPERKGSLQVELLSATRRAGRIAYVIDSDPAALIRELEAGRPVLVLQNLGTPRIPFWHYAVLVGIDPGENDVYLNSGKRERDVERAPTFLRTWNWGERWAMVVLEPGEFPESPDPLRYFQAVANFESVSSAQSAKAAWQAAAGHWPDDYRPHLALGNLAYQNGNFAAATQEFWKALELSPGQAAVENNLAESLAAYGCPQTAVRRLTAYVAQLPEDSPWREDLVATLNGLPAHAREENTSCRNYQSTGSSSPSVK